MDILMLIIQLITVITLINYSDKLAVKSLLKSEEQRVSKEWNKPKKQNNNCIKLFKTQ